MIKMMGGKFDDYYHGGEIIAAVWRAHTENGWARGGAITRPGRGRQADT